VIVESIDVKKIWQTINDWWARSMIAVLLFAIGMWIGVVNTESRIASDCKFAGAFRVEIQAFICQRKL
jgi:hypothetical protein